MTATHPPEDTTAMLSQELKHTLKLVPESQRELFVSELAEWYVRRINQACAPEEHFNLCDTPVMGGVCHCDAEVRNAKAAEIAAALKSKLEGK